VTADPAVRIGGAHRERPVSSSGVEQRDAPVPPTEMNWSRQRSSAMPPLTVCVWRRAATGSRTPATPQCRIRTALNGHQRVARGTRGDGERCRAPSPALPDALSIRTTGMVRRALRCTHQVARVLSEVASFSHAVDEPGDGPDSMSSCTDLEACPWVVL